MRVMIPVVLLFLSSACVSGEAEAIAELTGVAGAGQPLYDQNCAGCHGANGTGGTFDVNIVNLGKTDAQFIDVVLQGEDEMPPFSETLSDQQISDVVAYVRQTLGS